MKRAELTSPTVVYRVRARALRTPGNRRRRRYEKGSARCRRPRQLYNDAPDASLLPQNPEYTGRRATTCPRL